MPKITSVEPQKKNPHRFSIYLDGSFAFGADEDLVVDRRLVPGKTIAPADVEEVLFEAEVGKLMEKMYRLWNIRKRSEREVRDYFRIKNYESRIKDKEEASQIAIDALVETLKKKGMVNDLEFAKAWVEARRESRQKGIRAIKLELFQKGIDKEIIEEVTAAMGSEEELAKLALEKKIRFWNNLKSLELKKKAYEFLMRKGFDYEIVKKTIESLIRKE